MKTLEVLLFGLAVLTYVHSYNMDRSDREIEEFFRRRLPARPLEVRKTDKRAYCFDVSPMRCIVREDLCHDLQSFSSFQRFVSFVTDECPYTCGFCYK